MECGFELPVEGSYRESASFYQFIHVLAVGIELHDFCLEIEIVAQDGIEQPCQLVLGIEGTEQQEDGVSFYMLVVVAKQTGLQGILGLFQLLLQQAGDWKYGEKGIGSVLCFGVFV